MADQDLAVLRLLALAGGRRRRRRVSRGRRRGRRICRAHVGKSSAAGALLAVAVPITVAVPVALALSRWGPGDRQRAGEARDEQRDCEQQNLELHGWVRSFLEGT